MENTNYITGGAIVTIAGILLADFTNGKISAKRYFGVVLVALFTSLLASSDATRKLGVSFAVLAYMVIMLTYAKPAIETLRRETGI